MRRLSLFLVACLLPLAAGVPAARADLFCFQPQVQIGDVRSGVPLAHKFSLVNRGPEGVEITNLRPSCGCLTPQLSQDRLGAGEEGTLVLEVNTLTQPAGPHTWRVQVTYTTGGKVHEMPLVLQARVLTEVTVQPASLTIFTDAVVVHEVKLIERRDKPLTVTNVRCTSSWVKPQLGQPARDPSGQWSRSIQIDVLPGCPEGRRDETLSILTSDPGYPELRVPMTVIKRSRQQVSVTPATVAWEGPAGQPLPSRTVLLRVQDDQELVVEKVEADHPAVQCHWAAGSKQTVTIKLQLDRAKLSGDSLRGVLKVQLQKPAAQTLTVPLTWTTR
jgi:hypothetical protein